MANAAGYDEGAISAMGVHGVLFVHVTGIACSGSMCLVDIWESEFIEKLILSAKEAGYNTLYVVFYDPVEGFDETTKRVIWRKCVKELSKRHTLSEGNFSYIREYIMDEFRVGDDAITGEQIESEIIIDLAHIFNYDASGKPVYDGNVYSGLKVIYPGYIGPDIRSNGESIPSKYKYIMLSDIFYNHATGKSYIDIIVDVFGKLDVPTGLNAAAYPWDTVDNFLKGKRLIDEINHKLTEKRCRFTEYEHFMRSERAMEKVIDCLKIAASVEGSTNEKKDTFLSLVKKTLVELINSGI